MPQSERQGMTIIYLVVHQDGDIYRAYHTEAEADGVRDFLNGPVVAWEVVRTALAEYGRGDR